MIEFKQVHDTGVTVSVQTHDEHTLPDLVEVFRQFVLAIGYVPETVEDCLPRDG